MKGHDQHRGWPPRATITGRTAAVSLAAATLAIPTLAAATPSGPNGFPVAQGALPASGSWFWPTLIFVGVFLLLFILFRYLVFRFFIRYFSPGMARQLTICLFVLYAVTWVIFGTYVLFFCLVGLWKWALIFLLAIWAIWFIAVLLHRDDSVYFE